MAATAQTEPGTAARLVRSGLSLGAAIVAANVLNALFQVGLARVLEPGDYSLLATLFAAVIVLGVPALAVQTAVARDVAARLADADPAGAGAVLRESTGSIARLCLVLGAAGAVAGVPLAYALNIQHPWPLVGTAFTVAFSLELAVVWGGLQGANLFAPLSLGQLGHVALKLTFGFALGALGAGVAGIMVGVATAGAVTLCVFAAPLRGLWLAARDRPRDGRPLFGRYSRGVAASLSVFAALTSVDLLVARASFSPRTAGAYAAASVAARALLLIPTAVTTVLFPHVSTLADRVRERRHLLAGLATTAGLGALVVLLFAAFPHLLLDVTFGHSYSQAARWLAPLGAAMTLYALAYVYLFHFLALGRVRYVLVSAPVLLAQAPAYAAFRSRPGEVIGVQIVSAAVLVLVSELYDRRVARYVH